MAILGSATSSIVSGSIVHVDEVMTSIDLPEVESGAVPAEHDGGGRQAGRGDGESGSREFDVAGCPSEFDFP